MSDDLKAVSDTKPSPDPTRETTRQTERFLKAERDYVDSQLEILKQRIKGMDEATKVLNETVTRTPTEIQKEVKHLRELIFEKFDAVKTQFKERDTCAERESRDNRVAVDAAFSAQKESAAKQDESNQKSIDKSEKAIAEAINKLSELFKTTNDGLASQIADLKERISRLESFKKGSDDIVASGRANIAIIITIILAILTVFGFVVGRNP